MTSCVLRATCKHRVGHGLYPRVRFAIAELVRPFIVLTLEFTVPLSCVVQDFLTQGIYSEERKKPLAFLF